MTETSNTDLDRVIEHAILMSPRTSPPEDVAEAVADAVREQLAVECRDGYVITPEVVVELVHDAWTVTVDGVQLGQPREDVRFADYDV